MSILERSTKSFHKPAFAPPAASCSMAAQHNACFATSTPCNSCWRPWMACSSQHSGNNEEVALQQFCHIHRLVYHCHVSLLCHVPAMQLLRQLPSPSQQLDQAASSKQQGGPQPLMATGVQQATPCLAGEGQGQGPQAAAEVGAGHPQEHPLSVCLTRTLTLKR